MLNADDVKKLLPARARAKLDRMHHKAMAAQAALRGLSDEIAGAKERLQVLLMTFESQKRSNRQSEDQEPAEAAVMRQEIADLRASYEEVRNTAQTVMAPISLCVEWIGNVASAGARIVDAGPVDLKLGKATDPVKGVADLRDKISRLNAQYGEIEQAPAPVADLRKRALEALDELAAQGLPHLSTTTRIADPINLNERLKLPSLPLGDGRSLLAPLSISFLAWALRDVLAERICSLIEGTPCEGALSDDERDRRLRDIAAERLEAERLEEAWIEKAEAAGMNIPRRADADPRGVLGVRDQ